MTSPGADFEQLSFQTHSLYWAKDGNKQVQWSLLQAGQISTQGSYAAGEALN